MQNEHKQRRAKKDGSLFRRPLKAGGEAWVGKWTIDGQAVMRSVGRVKSPTHPTGLTPAQAEVAFRKLRDNAKPTPERVNAAKTMRDVADGLLESKRLKGLKPASLQAIDTAVRIHIVPFFVWPVHKITDEQVEQFRNHLLEDKGLAPKSVANTLGVLHGLFEYAIKRKWITSGINPVKGVESPKSSATSTGSLPRERYLTVEEVEALLRAVPDTPVGRVDRVMYLMAARTGLRQGELLALQWNDINWALSTVHVHRNYVRETFQSTKSGKGRTVPVTPQVLRELELLHQASRWQGDLDLVFAHPDTGNPMERSRLLKRFKAALLEARVGQFEPVLDAAGEPKRRALVDPRTNRWIRDENGEPITEPIERPTFRFHDLRHTFGTNLVSKGLALRKVQEWLGHADLQTTMIYSHMMPGAEDSVRIAAAFGEAELESEAEPKPSAGGSVPDRIRELRALHADGTITAEQLDTHTERLLAAL